MADAVDSSVLVAALAQNEDHHASCLAVIRTGNCMARTHAFSETFSTLTGGQLIGRFRPAQVVEAFQQTVLWRVRVADLSLDQVIDAMREADARGVRGGAIYDYLHLVAGRIQKA